MPPRADSSSSAVIGTATVPRLTGAVVMTRPRWKGRRAEPPDHQIHVFALLLHGDPMPAELLCHVSRRPGSRERVQHYVLLPRAAEDDPLQQPRRFLRVVRLLAVLVAQPLGPGAQGE